MEKSGVKPAQWTVSSPALLNHRVKLETLTILFIRTVFDPFSEEPIEVETPRPPHSNPSWERRQHRKLTGLLKTLNESAFL